MRSCLIAFTIVVLGGMGSVPGALIGGLLDRRGGKSLRPVPRRVARPDRHLPNLHRCAFGAAERAVWSAEHEGLRAHCRRRGAAGGGAAPSVQSNVMLNFLVVALITALAGQGWNILGGYGGQYSFGHAAFFGTGAYVTAVLQVRYGINAWLAFAPWHRAVAQLVGAVIGALTFRSGLRGSYFALVTLAFAEVLRIIASVAPITGAGVGTLVKLDLRSMALQFQSRAVFYWIILALVAVALVVTRLIERSRFGAWLVAVRENEDAAKALGVDATAVKLGAMIDFRRDYRGGGLLLRAVFSVRRFRHRLRHLDFDRSAADADHRRRRHRIRAAAWRVGDQGARRERARSLTGDAPGLDLVAYGCVLILMIWFAPRGLIAGGRMAAARPAYCRERRPAMADALLLAVESVSRRFGGLLAVKAVSFTAPAGRITGSDRAERCR